MIRKFLTVLPILSLCISCSARGGESLNAISPDDLFDIEGNVLVRPEVRDAGLIRNPCMGWGLYDDASDYVADSFSYWYQMDSYAQYATHLYIRWRWAELEPEEGKYVWLDSNSNFSRLIKGALDRGLKLAFRVYYDSDGNHFQATPDYVRLAGAEGRTETGWGNKQLWSPYADDPVFHEKLEKFVKAFAAEFDDPDRVFFVDGFNLGYWGEGHDISFSPGNDTPETRAATYDWITDLYGQAFSKVPLVINYHQEIGEDNLDRIVEKQGYQLRHDAFGSQWYSSFEKAYEARWRTKRMIVAESCYWFINTDKGTATSGNYDFTERWRGDPTYTPSATSWAQVYDRTFREAKEARANILDLREYREARSWLKESPELVEAFINEGGYRLSPVAVSFPQRFPCGSVIRIGHQWRNSGFGIFPNHDRRWGGKYKVAFAFLDIEGNVAETIVDEGTDPGDWLMEEDTEYVTKMETSQIPEGEYTLAIGIVDTSKPDLTAEIELAAPVKDMSGKWLKIGNISVTSRWIDRENSSCDFSITSGVDNEFE